MVEDATAASEGVIDDARFGASGTRATARWIASGFGALPGLALVTTLVRAPGEQGFDAGVLAIGIALAALGAILGILGFANVLAPVPLANKDLETFDMDRLRSPFQNYEALQDSIDTIRQELEGKKVEQARLDTDVKTALSEHEAAEMDAREAEELAKDSSDTAAKERAKTLRHDSDQKRMFATRAASHAASASHDLEVTQRQLDNRLLLRRDAYRLKASDEVASRFKTAQRSAIVATAFVAAGIGFLAMAPEPKSVESSELSLVTLRLNEDGKRALGCDVSTLQALRVGGEDSAPRVVTFPTEDCSARILDFPLVEPSPLGTMKEDAAVESG